MEKRNRNLYKLDDICLILSAILFIALIYQFRHLVGYLGGSDLSLLLDEARFLVTMMPIRLGGLLFSALFFLIVGRVVRKKEKISLEVIDAISYRSRTSVPSLAAELGRDVEKLEKIVKQLAALPGAGVSYDGNYVKIDRGESVETDDRYTRNYDSIVQEEIHMADNPAMPRNTDSAPERRNESTPINEVFNKDLSPDEMREKFQNIVKEKRAAAGIAGVTDSGSSSTGRKKDQPLKPNIPLLVILFFAFWPAAIIYLVGFSIKNSQAQALKNGISQNKPR